MLSEGAIAVSERAPPFRSVRRRFCRARSPFRRARRRFAACADGFAGRDHRFGGRAAVSQRAPTVLQGVTAVSEGAIAVSERAPPFRSARGCSCGSSAAVVDGAGAA
jgi:hypothetical protein